MESCDGTRQLTYWQTAPLPSESAYRAYRHVGRHPGAGVPERKGGARDAAEIADHTGAPGVEEDR